MKVSKGQVVFRVSAALLAAAAAGGQCWQRQPAGAGTAAVLAVVHAACTEELPETGDFTVGSGARAIDRCAYRLVMHSLTGRTDGAKLQSI